MKDGKLTNSELDELAARLVTAGSAAENDIEKIVSNPRLFDSVMARVTDSSRPPAARPSRTFRKPIAAAAFAAALFAISLGAYLSMGGPGTEVAEKQKAPARVYEVTEKAFEPSRPYNPPAVSGDVPPRAEPAVFRKPAERTEERRVRPAVRPGTVASEPAFQAIGLEEKAEDAALDGRIVRVELPRAALFAMGVNVPLENGTRMIRADILVGADGSPRAIRLVD